MARIYILYFRKDADDYTIFRHVVSYLEMMLDDDLPCELLMALMLHTSRSFVDSNPKAFSEGISMFCHSCPPKEILLVENDELLGICKEANEILLETIIPTNAFKQGMKKFLASIKRSNDDFDKAIGIMKGLQILLIEGADFNGKL